MLGTVITFFSFFTILTNILVATVFTADLLPPGWGQWFNRPSVQAGTAVYIAIVGTHLSATAAPPMEPAGCSMGCGCSLA